MPDDVTAAAEAMRNGKPDPGPKAETAATKKTDDLRRIAFATSKAAHDAALDLTAALEKIDRLTLVTELEAKAALEAQKVLDAIAAARAARAELNLLRTVSLWLDKAPRFAPGPRSDLGKWQQVAKIIDLDLADLSRPVPFVLGGPEDLRYQG